MQAWGGEFACKSADMLAHPNSRWAPLDWQDLQDWFCLCPAQRCSLGEGGGLPRTWMGSGPGLFLPAMLAPHPPPLRPPHPVLPCAFVLTEAKPPDLRRTK